MSDSTNTIFSAVAEATQASDEFERIALLALAQHVFDHKVRVPHSFGIDRHTDSPGMVISVHDHEADAWVESIAVDSDTAVRLREPNAFGRPTDRHTVVGRLPAMGHRITVRFYLPATSAPTSRLQVVS
jgi:hypothetical protein